MIDVQFPKTSARNVEGREFEIPGGLPGRVNLLALAFSREHQAAVQSWLPHFATLEREFPGLEAWNIPAIARKHRIWRSAIAGGIQAAVTDARVRSHTLVAYLDLGVFQQELGLPDLQEIRLYLVDGGGKIRWEGLGPYDPQTLASLRSALADLPGR